MAAFRSTPVSFDTPAGTGGGRHGGRGGVWRAARAGLGAALWRAPLLAVLFAGLAPLHTVLLEQHLGARAALTAAIFFTGGVAGILAAWPVCAVVARGRPWSARFAAAMVGHGLLVPLGTAFAYFLHYRMYYAQWHEAPFTEIWYWQVGYTGAAAIYFFAVGAVKFIFPTGLAALVLVAAMFCRWSRRLAP